MKSASLHLLHSIRPAFRKTHFIVLKTAYDILIYPNPTHPSPTPHDSTTMANPPSSPSFDWKMYRYTPSLPLAALFLALFSILTLLHVYAYIQHRRTGTIYVIIGGLCKLPLALPLLATPHDLETQLTRTRRGRRFLRAHQFALQQCSMGALHRPGHTSAHRAAVLRGNSVHDARSDDTTCRS